MPNREVSCFICKEMMYEFQEGILDQRRKTTVEHHLSWCKDCGGTLESQRRALHQLEMLSEAKISLKAVQDLKEKNRLISRNIGNRRRLPDSLRWGMEALLAAAIVAAGFHFGSEWWASRKLNAQGQEAEKIDTTSKEAGLSQPLPPDTLAEADIEAEEEAGGAVQSPEYHEHSDEVGKESAAAAGADLGGTDAIEEPDAPESQGANAEPETQTAAAPEQAETPAKKFVVPEIPLVLALHPPAPVPVAQNEPQPEKKEAIATQPKAAAPAVPSPATMASLPVSQTSTTATEGGFVYRMAMSLKGSDKASVEITKKILALGGQKAGQVQLGWKKPGGSYYHFTLPEANFTPLMNELKSFAQVRHSKDPHKRVMPAGQVRVILWVEELEPVRSNPAVKAAPESDAQTESSDGTDGATDSAEPETTTAPSNEGATESSDQEENE